MSNLQTFLNQLNMPLPSSFNADEWRNKAFSDHFFFDYQQEYFNEEDEIEFVQKLITTGPFLDLGAGNYRLSKYLQQKCKGFALDLSFFALTDKLVPAVCGDYRHLPFRGKFELILLAFGQICFLPASDLTNFLINLRKRLCVGGKIYLNLPTIEAIQELDGYNEWSSTNSGFQFWTRQYFPETDIFSQRQLLIDKQGQTVSDICFSYQMYSFYQLVEIFEQSRLQLNYHGQDFHGKPIGEGSQWMNIVISKN